MPKPKNKRERKPRINPRAWAKDAPPPNGSDPAAISDWFGHVGNRIVPAREFSTIDRRRAEVLALWAVREPGEMLIPFLRQYGIPKSTWFCWTADPDFRRALDAVNRNRSTGVTDLFHEGLQKVCEAQLANATLIGDPVSNGAAANIFKVLGMHVELRKELAPEVPEEQDAEALRKRLEELERIDKEYPDEEPEA